MDMEFLPCLVFFLWVLQSGNMFIEGCRTADWRNMTMEELLLKSDFVVYGKDTSHGKLRTPQELDARFTVYCVIKSGDFTVPQQLIIENIRDGGICSRVVMQTEVGKEYIVGLVRMLSGFTKYADINPLQSTAFPPTKENLEKLAATCGLDQWSPPKTGDQKRCPTPKKPRFCTKIRDPTSTASTVISSILTICLIIVLLILQQF